MFMSRKSGRKEFSVYFVKVLHRLYSRELALALRKFSNLCKSRYRNVPREKNKHYLSLVWQMRRNFNSTLRISVHNLTQKFFFLAYSDCPIECLCSVKLGIYRKARLVFMRDGERIDIWLRKEGMHLRTSNSFIIPEIWFEHHSWIWWDASE